MLRRILYNSDKGNTETHSSLPNDKKKKQYDCKLTTNKTTSKEKYNQSRGL